MDIDSNLSMIKYLTNLFLLYNLIMSLNIVDLFKLIFNMCVLLTFFLSATYYYVCHLKYIHLFSNFMMI